MIYALLITTSGSRKKKGGLYLCGAFKITEFIEKKNTLYKGPYYKMSYLSAWFSMFCARGLTYQLVEHL